MRKATDKPAHTAVKQRGQGKKRGRGATSSSISQRQESKRAYTSRSPLVLLLLLLLWSICLGCGLGLAMDIKSNPPLPPLTTGETGGVGVPPLTTGQTEGDGEVGQLGWRATVAAGASGGTVDPVSSRYQLGQELYRDNCGTCHIALSPAVLPTETWRNLLQDQEHYGTKLQPLIGPTTLILWEYLRTFSRSPGATEKIPYRVSESRYFKALHPRVKLSRNIKIASCVTCHPSAAQFNFRALTPEWENSP